MIRFLFLLGSLSALQAFAQPVVSKSMRTAMDRVDTNSIRSHISYLADDRLKGRLPGTEGYQMAVDYVVGQFRQMGVAPGGDKGGYTQSLILRKSVLTNKSAQAVLKDATGNTDTLSFLRDYVPVPNPMRTTSGGEGQLVFAGYGVEIPGEYSDYNGVDVKNKVVVVVTGTPSGLHSTLAAHFNNPFIKMQTAFSKGAVGALIISVARPSTNMDTVVQANISLNPEKTATYGYRSSFTGNLQFVMNGTRKLLKQLFINSGRNLDAALADIRNRKASSFALPLSLSVSYSNTHTDFESYNVIGLIPGSDAQLKKEYVVHSAHLDHIGVGKPLNGDSIYNGAHDNASGVASLLEIARLYKNGGARPKRSILIVMVTAEEMGLVGSAYFAGNPTVPKGSIVANVNTDMPTLIAPLLSIVPLGAEHSSLMKEVQFAAGQLGLDIEKDPEPNEFRFVRSDQYSFVMNKIPALHIKYGNKTNIPGFDMVNFVKEWRAKYYHRQPDNPDGIFDYAAAKKYVQLNFLISYAIAQAKGRPVWNTGDLFGE